MVHANNLHIQLEALLQVDACNLITAQLHMQNIIDLPLTITYFMT